jgi:acyl transferase domain-containing protein/acyl carrier protein
VSDSAATPGSANAIAVVGMAGRFPKSPTLDVFWRNVRDGADCLTRFTGAELAAAGVPDALRRDPAYVPVKGVIEDKAAFAASFFGVNPREAELTDPQHRLLLETAWEALEDAGYDPARTPGPVGVYVGVGMNSYLLARVMHADVAAHPGSAYEAFIGNDKDFSATRVSYKLGLQGPSVNVQTACSTSLVAVHLACQALLTFQCDMALAGAAAVSGLSDAGYVYSEGMILSPDGACRPFDALAGGTVPGEGVGVVTLKRLEDALAHGDAIRAVILGTAVNNDGSLKAGFTAPSIDGQREAIVLAHAMAQVEPETIGYVEAHGTATPLGDPIEVAALTQAFRERTDRVGFCALGSVKSNIGHTDTVAGVAGLIKAVLALEHREMPPTRHYTAPNPALNLPQSPFFVDAACRPWARGTSPRRAAVSSFGIGGTNAHAVLEEAPPRAERAAAPRWQVLTLSARSDAALDAMSTRLRDHLASHEDLDLADVAFTLQEGRRAFAVRRTVIAESRAAAVEALRANDPRSVHGGTAPNRAPLVAFMFTGQGAQYPRMGAGLYETEPVFRDAIDDCAARFGSILGEDVRDLFLRQASGADAAARLTRTRWAQPSLFAFEYALAALWMARGVEPDAMIGHSLGEYVAATIAGVWTLDDAARLVAARARLMDALPPGAMTAVALPEATVAPRLRAGLALAAVNAPGLVVVSGPTPEIESFEQDLAARGTTPRRLHTSHAFHSPMMEPMLAAFRDELSRTSFAPPARRYVSNVTGTWITAADATSPDYWLRHLRSPVRFADGLATLTATADRLLLEVGPGHALASLARQQPARAAFIVTSVRHPEEHDADGEVLARAAATLWRHGVGIDWSAARAGDPCLRVPLPTYPFERERFWIEVGPSHVDRSPHEPAGRAAIDRWFTVPTWTRVEARLAPPPADAGRWLVFDDARGSVAAALRRSGVAADLIVPVDVGRAFEPGPVMQVRPGVDADYAAAVAEACRRGGPPTRIVHAWATGGGRDEDEGFADYFSVLALAQAVVQRLDIPRARLDIVVTGAVSVTGDEVIVPARAAILGLMRVIPQEYPHLDAAVIDVTTPAGITEVGAGDAVARHLRQGEVAALTAWRGRKRWVRSFEPAGFPLPAGRPALIEPDGTYLITGAFGNIGAQVCDWLADEGVRRLVLVGRGSEPQAEDASADDETRRRRFAQVQRLRDGGVEVLVLPADMADGAAVRRVIGGARERFGRIAGVFHCAGTIRAVAVADLTREVCDEQFGAKCRGLWRLIDALADAPPDFIACTSSISVVLGGLGFGAYAAANTALDATVEAHPEHRIISVGWDSWEPPSGPVPAAGGLWIPPAEGREAWRRVMDAGPCHVIVSTTELAERIRRWTRPPNQVVTGKAPTPPTHARPNLSVSFTPASTDVEREMSSIWGALLGIASVGIHDNFFELGGHSLLATQLISRVRERFGVQLPLRAIFDASTVAELSRHVSGAQWATSRPEHVSENEEREEMEL